MPRQLALLPDVLPDDATATVPPTAVGRAAGAPGTGIAVLPGGIPASWRLDERTRAIGRQGVAQARAALRPIANPSAARVSAA